MINLTNTPTLQNVAAQLPAVFTAAERATTLLRNAWTPDRGTPVYTEKGIYTTRGWTEWTQGFQFGNAIYLYEATGNEAMLEYGRSATVQHMASHVSHIGVHDHGFNNVSTYGNLLRLMAEGQIPHNQWEAEFYRLALKITGAVQAARWTPITVSDGADLGYVYTFNGPHSLFSDTIRSMRALAVSHQLGHVLMGEQDRRISLLQRIIQHAEATARYNVYFGEGRDGWDIRGRVVHESIFNTNNGVYRCPSTQQGYTPFSTWTRGLAWILSGYPEQLEWLRTRTDDEFALAGADRRAVEARWLQVACATADFHLENTPTDGIPYWDTGAPGLVHLGDYMDRPADPYNQHEPVDSSAAAISAQGLWRLADYLDAEAQRLAQSSIPVDLNGEGAGSSGSASSSGNAGNSSVSEIRERAERYRNAALVTAATLFDEPYISTGKDHQGILLHSIYHQPNRWDYVHPGQTVANGESCMWGDYHLMELAVMVHRAAAGKNAQRFFDLGEQST